MIWHQPLLISFERMVFPIKKDGFKRNSADAIYLASISLTDHKQCEYKVPEKDQYS